MNILGSAVVAAMMSVVSVLASADERLAIRNYQAASVALQGAKAVARAGRGQILAVGGLMTETAEPSNSVVVLTRVDEADIRPGMVLIMEKLDCSAEVCLVARRVTSTEGKIDTEPYPSIEGLIFREVRATVLGAVAYTVNLDDASIRDLQPGHRPVLSFEDAVAQERRTLSSALLRP